MWLKANEEELRDDNPAGFCIPEYLSPGSAAEAPPIPAERTLMSFFKKVKADCPALSPP
jgi:hypothetical protein